jgi:hypothetical protein
MRIFTSRAARRAAARAWVDGAACAYLAEQIGGTTLTNIAEALQVGPVALSCSLAHLEHARRIRTWTAGDGRRWYALIPDTARRSP